MKTDIPTINGMPTVLLSLGGRDPKLDVIVQECLDKIGQYDPASNEANIYLNNAQRNILLAKAALIEIELFALDLGPNGTELHHAVKNALTTISDVANTLLEQLAEEDK
jgi:hypothetical protein